ncbi:ATP-binding protein [Rhizobium alvei]|uniref:AAA family ATPase n=1 Tax=Rhizobium alvei TaxID=1132659 RepID=A0ABT8YQP0_9HYPH|nr:AAA family ATPase [Rhizobium alvei]MDO6966034.1 AAA family ATPase [Rhizobium alvei]
MRLRRLDLTRYGKFTDLSLDFGEPIAGAPDLHIIYGLNEAGKSTTFAAYLDLLYGIGNESPYGFLHPYSTMQIGAALSIDGRDHELIRVKKRMGSLLDPQGQPVNEALLSSALGGIGRDAYRTMFSLDDQSLKEGGDAIIRSRGELGELLFSASSGLSGLNKALAAAADEASAIHRKRASSTAIAELKRELQALKAERDALDIHAGTYASLSAAHVQARSAYEEVSAQLAERRQRHAELDRLLGSVPLALEHRRLLMELGDQPELPRPPSEWFSLLPRLMQDETRLEALIERNRAEIARLEESIGSIGIDPRLDEIRIRLAALEDLRARDRTARNDLPKRRAAFAEQNAVLAAALRNLGRADEPQAERLLLPASTVAEITALIESRSGIVARHDSAEAEAVRSAERLQSLADAMEQGSPDAAPDREAIEALERMLARIDGADLAGRLTLERRNLERRRAEQAAALAALIPWHGSVEALTDTRALDAQQLTPLAQRAAELERSLTDLTRRQSDLAGEMARIKARRESLTGEGTIDDQTAAASRTRRDSAWQDHRQSLDQTSADRFESAMREDDRLTDLRLLQSRALASLRELDHSLAEQAALLRETERQHGEGKRECEALKARISALSPIPVAPDESASESLARLEAWLLRRDKALDAITAYETARQDVAELEEAREAEQTLLVRRMAETGLGLPEGSDAADRIETARKAIRLAREQSTDAERKRREREEAQRDHQLRLDHQSRARQALTDWTMAWEKALAGTWFSDRADSPAAIRGLLEALAELRIILNERDQLAQRVATMERDQALFAEAIRTIAQEFGDTDPDADPAIIADRLTGLCEAGLRDRTRRRDLETERDKLREAERRLINDLADHERTKAELLAFAGEDSLAGVSAYLETVRERQALVARRTELETQITAALRVSDFAVAAARLQDLDIEATERDQLALTDEIEALAERSREQLAEMTRAADRLAAVGGDDAVARIEARRRTIFLDIADRAETYLKLRAGVMAAEQALHLYRESHRSSMMLRASDAFQTITGGAYSGLAARLEKESETLIGLSREGASKSADSLSTGTRFQLYLALRLAGYEEFAQVRPPVPFIADDIMETFDDPRSEQVFRLLGDVSRIGQVIYLTHHRHLCDIAERIVPGARIHHLP